MRHIRFKAYEPLDAVIPIFISYGLNWLRSTDLELKIITYFKMMAFHADFGRHEDPILFVLK